MPAAKLKFLVLLEQLFSFGLVGVLSILVTLKLQNIPIEIPPPEPFSWRYFLVIFAVGTVIIFVLAKLALGRRLLRLFFIFALFSGTTLTLSAFSATVGLGAPLIAALLIIFYLFRPYVWFHNFLLVLTLAGVSALLGVSLKPSAVVLLLVIMSFYDILAVYVTKHMIVMIKEMIVGRAISAMIFAENIADLRKPVYEAWPAKGFFLLGSGDFVFPAILISSVFKISPAAGACVFLFSLLGFVFTHLIFVLQKARRPMPALPSLAAFSILGFLAAYFLGIY